MEAVTYCVSSALSNTSNAGNSSNMSSSFVGSPLQTSLGVKMACRSLSGVALKTYTVEIGYAARFLSTGRHEDHLWLKNERRLQQNVWHASPRSMLLSTRACGNNLFSGSTRRGSGMQWQSRNTSDGNYNARTSGVCDATTSSQGVSANKVLLLLDDSFIPLFVIMKTLFVESGRYTWRLKNCRQL